MSRPAPIHLVACIMSVLMCAGCVTSGDLAIPIPLIPVVAITSALREERVVAHVGERVNESTSGGGSVYEVSDRFTPEDLRHLHEIMNSAKFQARLAKYNCGDPVPKLTFNLTLFRDPTIKTNALSVVWRCRPLLDPVTDRGLMFGVSYLAEKEFAKLETTHRPNQRLPQTTREPHVDCSKRLGKEEWVTFPGPTEILWDKK